MNVQTFASLSPDSRGRLQRSLDGTAHDNAEEQLALATNVGARWITPEDDDWPDIGDIDLEGLWVRGDVAALHNQTLIHVTGSRSCTVYGAEVALSLANHLTDEGYGIINGGAFGIDASAIRGALTSGGQPVVVLGCGIANEYPTAHAALFSHVLNAGGAIVSQYQPGASVSRERFLGRHRLVAGLAKGVVVVEAARRSSAIVAAMHAKSMGKPVMAVPGPVTSAVSGGTHALIRDSGAYLVTSASDVDAVIGGSR